LKAFLTGSYAYGTPHEDSDIDLVVLISQDDLNRLASFDLDSYYSRYGKTPDSHYGRFGNLNLLCVTTELEYNIWLDGTKELVAKRPVTRDEAVETFQRLQRERRPPSISWPTTDSTSEGGMCHN
jgi:hypothetical protein